MKRDARGRAGRTDATRSLASVEALEGRQLMTGSHYSFNTGTPSTILTPQSVGKVEALNPTGQAAVLQGNEGRFLTGQDRQGDTWTLTLHGPGSLVVTDTTPNDGSLDDDIDTIQILNSNINTTYVTGTVSATARTIVDPDTGIVFFHHLIAEGGVKSIVLNGFTLESASTLTSQNSSDGIGFTEGTATIAGQVNNTGPAIYLPGGVKTLAFHDILNVTDEAGNGEGADQPLEIQIGDPNTPLTVSPSITIDGIFNTVIDSSATSQAGLGPQTAATVNIEVNGNIHAINIGSATAQTVAGGFEYDFPRVDVTGRTAIRATGIDHLKVVGSARNLTASRAGTPFVAQTGEAASTTTTTTATTQVLKSGFSRLTHLGTADFGGTADAVGLDVTGGTIGRVRFARGLGDTTGKPLNASQYGSNGAEAGYPSKDLLGGVVAAQKIGKVVVGASEIITTTGTNPADARRVTVHAGRALTNAAITSSGSIGSVKVTGDSQNSEIASGYDYKSFVAGLEPVRARSQIGKYNQKGDLIDSVVSASYRPNDSIYGDGDDTAGPGKITGKLNGRLYVTGNQTVLANFGAGVYAKIKKGYLPPPEGPLRTKSGKLKG